MNGTSTYRRASTPSRLSVTVLCAGLILFAVGPALYHGINRFYLEYPDADVMFPYWALLVNADLPQGWYDHPAAFYILALGYWYQLLKTLGFIDVATLYELPGPNTFEPFFADLVISGRVFGLILGAAMVILVFYGLWRLTGRLWLATLAAAFLSSTPGYSMHLNQLRSELMSSALLCALFFLLVSAGRSLYSERDGWKIAAAVVCGVIAVETKVIAIIPMLALVITAPFFSREKTPALAFKHSPAQGKRTLIYIIALTMVIPAASELYFQWNGFRVYFLPVVLAPRGEPIGETGSQ